ncbi:MAG: rhodanese family protein [Phycisphaeraceae bacterium]|nr:rhodanese family protein [Phycisphaeraceae bacterium]
MISETSKHTDQSGIGQACTELDPRTAHDWHKAGKCMIVDVREPDEHAHEHIEGAKLVSLSTFDPAKIGARPGQSVVFQCRSGKRSQDAARLAAGLASSGVQIFNLTGGINAWKDAQLPVSTNKKVTGISVMRQVQMTIGVGVLAGCALTWFVHPLFVLLPAFFGAGLLFAGATGTCGLAAVIGRMPWNRAG